MKRLKLALAASAAVIALGSAASAADLPAYEPAPVVAVPSFTWTGAYVGVQAGYGWAKSSNTGADPKGWLVGAYAGYNFQFDNSPVVVGLETDFNYSDQDDRSSGVKQDLKWAGATRARIGYAFDRFLVYGAGGLAYAKRDFSGGGFSSKKTATGWTAGAGLEYAATDNVIVRGEYRYSDYGSDRFNGARSDLTEHRVMGGVAYKF